MPLSQRYPQRCVHQGEDFEGTGYRLRRFAAAHGVKCHGILHDSSSLRCWSVAVALAPQSDACIRPTCGEHIAILICHLGLFDAFWGHHTEAFQAVEVF